eukprot:gene10882-12698_t
MDEFYARALQLRDCKMSGCSVEESKAEAEMLFLELGQQGHAKAMHNYAVLQQKKGNYKLAADWFDKAGLEASRRNIKAMRECGQIKEDLYLVVGSDRNTFEPFGLPMMGELYGRAVDRAHLHSFGGNATTCDIEPCAIPGAKHIQADALTFDFARNYNLKHVLLERFPTMNPAAPFVSLDGGPVTVEARDLDDIMESEARANFFGSVVQNLSKAMEPGAILEIEWDPYTTQYSYTSREQCEMFHTLNPFHGYFRIDEVACIASMDPRFNLSMFSADLLPADSLAMVREFGGKFRAEVEFWHAQSAGKSFKDLSDRMRAEVTLYSRLNLSSSFTPYQPALLAFVEANLITDSTEKIVAALRNARLDHFSPELAGRPCQMPDGRRGWIFNPGKLVTISLMGMAINSLAVQNNTPYAKLYLESIGFKDVVIERRTNIHNGRKNVWMVRAVKA